MKEVKQAIIWRADLKEMPLGKKLSQVGHAGHLFLTNRIRNLLAPVEMGAEHPKTQQVTCEYDSEEAAWIAGEYKKVVLVARSEAEMQTLFEAARNAGLRVNIVTDLGLTVFKNIPTVTCMAIGPNFSEDVDKITGESGPLGKLRLA